MFCILTYNYNNNTQPKQIKTGLNLNCNKYGTIDNNIVHIEKLNIVGCDDFKNSIRVVIIMNDSRPCVLRRMIVSDGYNIFNKSVIQKFKIKMTPTYINCVCRDGLTDILDFWKKTNQKLDYSEWVLLIASKYGRVNVLTWWKNSGLPLNYCRFNLELNEASKYGHVNVLEWWKNSGLLLRYNDKVLIEASTNGHIDVLNWWKNSGLKVYTHNFNIDILKSLCEKGQFAVIEWWINSGLLFKYNVNDLISSIINVGVENNNNNVLEWLKNSGLLKGIDDVSSNNNINFLEWWKNSGLPLTYSEKAINSASECGHVNVLEWWKNSGLPLKYNENAIDLASENDHVAVLEWWKNSGLPLKYSNYAIDSLCGKDVLEWWKNSGLELKYSNIALEMASEFNLLNVLDWWLCSGLPLKYSIGDLRQILRYVCSDDVVAWWSRNFNISIP